MRCSSKCALVLAGTLCLSTCLPAAELEPARGGLGSGGRRRHGTPEEFPWEVLSEEPEYGSDKPLYVTLELGSGGDRIVTAVLDESRGAGTGYDTLRLDANNNGNLTDDPPLESKATKDRRSTTFKIEPVAVRVKYHDGKERTLRIRLDIRSHRYGSDRTYWTVYSQLEDHLEGKVSIGQRPDVLVGIYDGARGEFGQNGCFDDFGIDRLRIDLDGDGKLDPGKEDFPLSKVISFDGRLWELRTDAAASRFDIAPCGLPAGLLEIRSRFTEGAVVEEGRTEAVSNRGYAVACEISEGGASRLPAGRFRVSGSLTLLDGAGKKWKSTFSWQRPVRVRPEKTSAIAMGMPAKVEPVVSGTPRPGLSIQISYRLVGAGGETYGAIARDGKREQPRVKVVDAEGIEVASGKMEYG